MLAAAYVDFIRNTPLIVQLFFIAFGMPLLFGYVWPFWCHALLALSINFSGYFAEILRSGFLSFDDLAKRFGAEKATAFYQEAKAARADLAQFIISEKIDCDLNQCGRLVGALRPRIA